MTKVYSFETKREKLSPEQLLKNATDKGQDKVLIASLAEDGEVRVYSSDGISPAELLYMCYTTVDLAGAGALESRNTSTFFEGFIED